MSPQQSPVASFLKRLLLLIIFGTASIFLIKAIYAFGLAQSPDERKVKTQAFRDMPVEVVEVRNLQSETWWKDLEIEVKNVSTKPIYYLRAYLIFTDEKLTWGESAVALVWGDPKKLDSRKYAAADTERVEPGKTFVLTVPEMYRKGLEGKQRRHPELTKHFELDFYKISFGDGTEIEARRLRDFRGNDPPPKPQKRHHPSLAKVSGTNHSTTSTPVPSAVEVIVLGG
jgi:hypothetical protein